MTNDQWFALTVEQRKSLIKEAGYASNSYSYRVWEHLPYSVKMDVAYVIHRRKQREKQAQPVLVEVY